MTTHMVRKLGSLALPANAKHPITSTFSGTLNTDVIVARR